MLKNWLRNALSGKTDEKIEIGADEGKLQGLSLKNVLDAHSAWKGKLEKELSGQNRTIDPSIVGNDEHCELGKWIYGTGKELYSNLPEYEMVQKAHAHFHITAAEVVIEHQSGNTDKAENLLKSTFRSASNSNQLQLVRLFTTAKG